MNTVEKEKKRFTKPTDSNAVDVLGDSILQFTKPKVLVMIRKNLVKNEGI